ncbi:hypothetical protein DBV15_05701 [Temnothorax longispinosus]|uniref:Uncharacterized protein n=1 Tax=Temnothorax longispinosus TaxID=300112 RepID=A0A4S2JBG2_9HYME|nr:hypothetical protein DBV15_05701 [Temnothorax longispinosus]
MANPLMRIHMCSLMFFRDKNELRHSTAETAARRVRVKEKPRLALVSPLAKRLGFVRRLRPFVYTLLRQCKSRSPTRTAVKQSALAGKRAVRDPEGRRRATPFTPPPSKVRCGYIPGVCILHLDIHLDPLVGTRVCVCTRARMYTDTPGYISIIAVLLNNVKTRVWRSGQLEELMIHNDRGGEERRVLNFEDRDCRISSQIETQDSKELLSRVMRSRQLRVQKNTAKSFGASSNSDMRPRRRCRPCIKDHRQILVVPARGATRGVGKQSGCKAQPLFVSPQRELRAGMTPANRAELRGESEREGRKGARVPSSLSREENKGEKEDEGEERDANEEGVKPARASGRSMASSHSSVFTVRGHPRARATFGFSTSYLARVADAGSLRINRIINDRSRTPRAATHPRDLTRLDDSTQRFEICGARR